MNPISHSRRKIFDAVRYTVATAYAFTKSDYKTVFVPVVSNIFAVQDMIRRCPNFFER